MPVMRTTVWSCRWPRLRREFCRRRFLKAITFLSRPWRTISPVTLMPDRVGGTDLGGARAVREQEDLAEGHGLAGLAGQGGDGDGVVGGDAVLLTARLDDCEHRSLVFSNGLRGGCPWTGFLFEVIERA